MKRQDRAAEIAKEVYSNNKDDLVIKELRVTFTSDFAQDIEDTVKKMIAEGAEKALELAEKKIASLLSEKAKSIPEDSDVKLRSMGYIMMDDIDDIRAIRTHADVFVLTNDNRLFITFIRELPLNAGPLYRSSGDDLIHDLTHSYGDSDIRAVYPIPKDIVSTFSNAASSNEANRAAARAREDEKARIEAAIGVTVYTGNYGVLR